MGRQIADVALVKPNVLPVPFLLQTNVYNEVWDHEGEGS